MVNTIYVLDTSALLALRGNESGAARVEQILRQATKHKCTVLLSFMSRMEIIYQISRHEGEMAAAEALRLIDTMSATWVSCTPEILETAARIKSLGGLSVADAWIAATARIHGAHLIHKDPEFRVLNDIQQEEIS